MIMVIKSTKLSDPKAYNGSVLIFPYIGCNTKWCYNLDLDKE
jgi:hypothetical protein